MEKLRLPALAGVLLAAGLVGVVAGVALMEEFRYPSGDTGGGDPVQRPRWQLLGLLIGGGLLGWVGSILAVAPLFRNARSARRATAVAVPVGAAAAAAAGVGIAASVGFRDTTTIRTAVTAAAAITYVGILRCERPVKQEEIDLDQLTRLREYFETIKGEALYLGYVDTAGLSRHVDAILNQAVARGGAHLDDLAPATGGASVWPRVDRERYQETDSKGRLRTKTRWRLVLVNDGAEPARDVSFKLDPYGEHSDEAQAPMVLDNETPIEALAPKREIAYSASLHSGTTHQARCTVRWIDSEGEHEQASTVGFG